MKPVAHDNLYRTRLACLSQNTPSLTFFFTLGFVMTDLCKDTYSGFQSPWIGAVLILSCSAQPFPYSWGRMLGQLEWFAISDILSIILPSTHPPPAFHGFIVILTREGGWGVWLSGVLVLAQGHPAG